MARPEHLDYIPPYLSEYIASAAVLLTLGATGCYATANKEDIVYRPERGIDAYVELMPNLSGFLSISEEDTCSGGGARPCALLIRSEPILESLYINAVPGQKLVKWPLEAFAGKAGDPVLIDCYNPKGQNVYALDGSSSSRVWYRVIVQAEHINNNELTGELLAGNIMTLQYAGKSAMYAWAAAEWFGQATPSAAVEPC